MRLDNPLTSVLRQRSTETKRPMKGIIDYGDDGVVPMINSEDVNVVVENILEYVENRFDVLDKQGGREGDIMALCQEFYEWGSADVGDELSYFTCPSFEQNNDYAKLATSL